MTEEFNILELHPKILVFKGLINNGKEIIDHYESSHADSWTGWYTFGSKIELESYPQHFDNFPSEEEWDIKVLNKISNPYSKSIASAFYKATNHYRKTVGIDIPDWIFDPYDMVKYYERSGVSDSKAMSFHTDYDYSRSLDSGSKLTITCLHYLNDNYEGGQIRFRVFNEDLSQILHDIEYKPEAGDVIVFPSGDPRFTQTNNFFHGVRIVESGEKYLVRSYWKYWYDGDPEYMAEIASYPEEERENILQERRKRAWIYISDKTNVGFE